MESNLSQRLVEADRDVAAKCGQLQGQLPTDARPGPSDQRLLSVHAHHPGGIEI